MKVIKSFIFDHFELLLVFFMICAAEIVNFYLLSKISFLNFYYFPVLLAGYYVGKRHAIATSLASVFLIALFFLIWPEYMTGSGTIRDTVVDLSVWAFFLILAGYLIGTLYEQKEKKVDELKLAYVGILEILSKYLESYDRYTKGHSVRVSKLATEIAISLHLPRNTIENIRVGSLLHDIGKVDVSIDLIQKSADLTQTEKELINEHSSKGAELLGLVGNVLKEAIPLVQAHHYSYLDAEVGEVPMGARIIAVADSYDALVTDRPYRAAVTPWQAIAEINKESGKKFDPQVVDALKNVLTETSENTVPVTEVLT